MTTKEVLTVLGCSRASLYKLMKNEKLRPLPRVEGLSKQPLRFRRADVLALLGKGGE